MSFQLACEEFEGRRQDVSGDVQNTFEEAAIGLSALQVLGYSTHRD